MAHSRGRSEFSNSRLVGLARDSGRPRRLLRASARCGPAQRSELRSAPHGERRGPPRARGAAKRREPPRSSAPPPRNLLPGRGGEQLLVGEDAARRGARAAEQAASARGRAARGGRRRPTRLLRLPRRPLDEAALDQPAQAGQPRDRPPHRRRRHLPQRPLADPPRRQHRDRAKRRMARRSPLPQRSLGGSGYLLEGQGRRLRGRRASGRAARRPEPVLCGSVEARPRLTEPWFC